MRLFDTKLSAGRRRLGDRGSHGVSTKAQHPVHLRDRPNHTGVVACLFRLPRRALQATDALKQLTLIEVVVREGHIRPLFVSISQHATGVQPGAPPCFDYKRRKIAETYALVDLFRRQFMALLLLLLRHPLGRHNRPAPMNASSTSAKAEWSRYVSAMVAWIN